MPDKTESEFGYTPGTALRILGYFDKEENAWVALALEMDIRGYGETIDDALNELRDLVSAQISFAYAKKDPGLVHFPAERKYFDIYEEVQQKIIHSLLTSQPAATDYVARSLAIPPAHVIKAMQARDTWANA